MLGSFLKPHHDPPPQFRFGVFFFASGLIPIPNPLDIHFQKVSGLSTEIEVQKVRSGGENLVEYSLPQKVTHGNLALERGMVIGSILNLEFNAAMSLFKFSSSNVLITLFSEDVIPLAGWLCMNAYPVKWSVSDLDANSNGIMIDTMELAYTRLQILRI